MKSARNTSARGTSQRRDVRCRLARDDHAVSVMDARDREISRCTIEHSVARVRELLAVLARAGAAEVAIEQADGPLVDALLVAVITMVVISSNRSGPARPLRVGRNKDDRFNAFVLADILRTARSSPTGPATVALRRACRAQKDIVSYRVGPANQLRAHLRNALAGAVGLFKDIDSPARLGKWLASSSYPAGTSPAELYARLRPRRGATGEDGQAHLLHHPRPTDFTGLRQR